MNTSETAIKTPRRSTAKQRRASRINGSRSKGPVTEIGKNSSRRNSLKHGLSGEGIVLIEAEEQRVEERLAEWTKAANVQNPIQGYLIQRAVIASVRLDVIDQVQEARRVKRLVRLQANERIVGSVHLDQISEPWQVKGHVRALKFSAIGCDHLAELWAELGETLLDNRETDWTDQHRLGMIYLLEIDETAPTLPCSFHKQLQIDSRESLNADPEAVDLCRQYLQDEAIDPAQLTEIETTGSDGSKALLKLIRQIVENIHKLEAMADELEAKEGPERDQAIERSALDLSKTGVLLQRYQNQATNELTKMLREVRREQALEAQNAQKPNEPGAAVFSPKPVAAPKTCAETIRQKQARVIAEATSKTSVMNTLMARLQADKARDAQIDLENRPLEPARS